MENNSIVHQHNHTSRLGLPPLYFNIRFSSFSSVTFNLTFCLGVLSPLSKNVHLNTNMRRENKHCHHPFMNFRKYGSYCRITAITQRSSSDCPKVSINPLPARVNPSDGWTASWLFQGKIGGIVEEICGAFASKNIFLNKQAVSSKYLFQQRLIYCLDICQKCVVMSHENGWH